MRPFRAKGSALRQVSDVPSRGIEQFPPGIDGQNAVGHPLQAINIIDRFENRGFGGRGLSPATAALSQENPASLLNSPLVDDQLIS